MVTKTEAPHHHKATTQESPAPDFPPKDPSHEKFLAEQSDLERPGKVSKEHASQIDNAPGYSINQLDHMREYYGLVDA